MAAKSPALFKDGRALVAPLGITPQGCVYRNLSVDALYQAAVQRGQAEVIGNGALLQNTMPYGGRAAKSSFYVNDPSIVIDGKSLDDLIAWGDPGKGEFDNLQIGDDVYQRLKARVIAHLSADGDVYINDGISVGPMPPG